MNPNETKGSGGEEYKKLAMKTSKANKELKEDTQELNKDKAAK